MNQYHGAITMAPTPEELQRARDRLADGERLVADQRAIVAELTEHGHDAAAAERLPAVLEQALETMREHLAIEEDLARSDSKE